MFILPKRCGWFYIIQQSLNHIWGFGIATSEEGRLKKYGYHSCSKETFWNLYYGDYGQIIDLEFHLKNQWKNKMISLYGTKKLEWFDPKHNVTGDDIKLFCDTRILQFPYDRVYQVKPQFLPYSPSKIFKNIKETPELYLDPVTLDNESQN